MQFFFVLIPILGLFWIFASIALLAFGIPDHT